MSSKIAAYAEDATAPRAAAATPVTVADLRSDTVTRPCAKMRARHGCGRSG